MNVCTYRKNNVTVICDGEKEWAQNLLSIALATTAQVYVIGLQIAESHLIFKLQGPQNSVENYYLWALNPVILENNALNHFKTISVDMIKVKELEKKKQKKPNNKVKLLRMKKTVKSKVSKKIKEKKLDWNFEINEQVMIDQYGFEKFTLMDKLNTKFSNIILAVKSGYLGLMLGGFKTVEYRKNFKQLHWKHRYIGLGLSGTDLTIRDNKYEKQVVKFSDKLLMLLQNAGVKKHHCTTLAFVEGKFGIVAFFCD